MGSFCPYNFTPCFLHSGVSSWAGLNHAYGKVPSSFGLAEGRRDPLSSWLDCWGSRGNGKASWEGKPREDWEEREHPWRLIVDIVTTLDLPLSFLPRLPVELTFGGLAWGGSHTS